MRVLLWKTAGESEHLGRSGCTDRPALGLHLDESPGSVALARVRETASLIGASQLPKKRYPQRTTVWIGTLNINNGVRDGVHIRRVSKVKIEKIEAKDIGGDAVNIDGGRARKRKRDHRGLSKEDGPTAARRTIHGIGWLLAVAHGVAAASIAHALGFSA